MEHLSPAIKRGGLMENFECSGNIKDKSKKANPATLVLTIPLEANQSGETVSLSNFS